MAEAVIKMARNATDLGRTVGQLKADTSVVLERLKQIDPVVADATRRLADYHSRLQAGGTLGAGDRSNVQYLQQLVNQRLEAMRPTPATAAPAAAPPPAAPAAPMYFAGQRVKPGDPIDAALRRQHPGLFRAAPPAPEAAQQQEAQLDKQTAALRRSKVAEDLRGASDQQLIDKWKQQNALLQEQQREIPRAEAAFERLTKQKQAGVAVDEDELRAARDRAVQLRLARGETLETVRAAETEARRVRGFNPAGAPPSGPGGFQRMAGAFLGGAGIGSGSIGGTAAGAILGTMSWPVALMAMAGIGVSSAVDYGMDAYKRYGTQTGRMLPLGVASGISTDALLQGTRRQSDRWRLDVDDIRAAEMTLGRGAGHTDMASIIRVARATGQTVQEVAQQAVAMNRLAPQYDPRGPEALVRAYGQSAVARPRPGGLGYDTLLLPQFMQRAVQLQHSLASPYTRVSQVGAAQELTSATRHLRMLGINRHGAGGLDVAANVVEGANKFVGTEQGGVLGELQMMAIARLRNDPEAMKKLAAAGYDLNRVPDMLRAIENAPQLATKGIPEVATAIYRAPFRALPRDLAEMAIADATGNRNLAHLLATNQAAIPQMFKDAGKREPVGPEVDAAAREIAARPDVERYYNMALRPTNRQEEVGQNIVGDLGDRITKGINDLNDKVVQTLETFFNKDVAVPGTPASIQTTFPGMFTPSGVGSGGPAQ